MNPCQGDENGCSPTPWGNDFVPLAPGGASLFCQALPVVAVCPAGTHDDGNGRCVANAVPQCRVEVGYQGAIIPSQSAVNHSYLYVQPSPGSPFEVLDAGPQRAIPYVILRPRGLPRPMYVGFGKMVTDVSAQGMYQEATNPASTVTWAQYEPCWLVAKLISDTEALNGVYDYGGLSYNSNSFVYTVLWDVGLSNAVHQPARTPGWGDLFLIP